MVDRQHLRVVDAPDEFRRFAGDVRQEPADASGPAQAGGGFSRKGAWCVAAKKEIPPKWGSIRLPD